MLDRIVIGADRSKAVLIFEDGRCVVVRSDVDAFALLYQVVIEPGILIAEQEERCSEVTQNLMMEDIAS